MTPAPDTVDFASATASVAALDRSLRSEAGADGSVCIDLSTLSRFDSSALAVLLELRRRFGGASGRFAVVNPPAKLRGLAEVYGVAELLFGDIEPSGRLPISWPRHVGQQPVFYNQIPHQHGTRYADLTQDPQWVFGEGLSYSSVAYSDLRLDSAVLGLEDVTVAGQDQ